MEEEIEAAKTLNALGLDAVGSNGEMKADPEEGKMKADTEKRLQAFSDYLKTLKEQELGKGAMSSATASSSETAMSSETPRP